MTKRRRPGFYKMPRWLFQQNELSTDQRWLLAYFDSFVGGWVHSEETVLRNTGWGRQKYYRIRRELVEAGRLKTEVVRATDKNTGKAVTKGFQAAVEWPDQTAENHNSESASDCRKSSARKSSPIRRASLKGRQSQSDDEICELVEDDDVVHFPVRTAAQKSSGST